MKHYIDILDCSSKSSIYDMFTNVFGLDEEKLREACSFHKNHDVYWYEVFEKLFYIDLTQVSIGKIVLHHVSNYIDNVKIEDRGIHDLCRLLTTKSSISKFLQNLEIEYCPKSKDILYKGEKLKFNVLESNAGFRLKADSNVHSFLFLQDVINGNYYTNRETGILLRAPEFILELNNVLEDIDLEYEWNKQTPKVSIVSFVIEYEDIEYDDTKMLLNDILQWYCEGKSDYSNDILLKENVPIQKENIISVIKLI